MERILLKYRTTVEKLTPEGITPRIVGGQQAKEGQFPWQVALTIDDVYFCGGSLISTEWILTSGHCVISSETIFVRAGSLSPDYNGETTVSTEYIIHENYNPYTVENDIALISIKDLEFNELIDSIHLPSSNIGDLIGNTVIVSGWGLTSDNASDISPTLNYAELVVIENDICRDFYGDIITVNHLCISTSNGQSTCGGDSGSPFIVQDIDNKWSQVGIVSFGYIKGCEVEAPIGAIRISSYLEWIATKTQITF